MQTERDRTRPEMPQTTQKQQENTIHPHTLVALIFNAFEIGSSYFPLPLVFCPVYKCIYY